MRELRVLGPPGTGKTTRIKRDVGTAATRYGAERILVASYSRAAALELVSRDLGMPSEHVGTLHAICYRALGKPTIADTRTAEWNEVAGPYLITGRTRNEPLGGEQSGDGALAEYSRLRALMVARDRWPLEIRSFAARWETWKREREYYDFTDLIERALTELPEAPDQPEAGFFDEAQDFSAQETALVRQWGQHMRSFVMVGDDDQVLFSFRGASPDALLSPLEPEYVRVLEQSYRVPRTVHAFATRWIRQVRRRNEKVYFPRDADGVVRRSPVSYADPERLLDEVRTALGRGGSVMVLGSCGYLLNEFLSACRDAGVPYHNPYKRGEDDGHGWNPLTPSKGIGVAQRILAYLRPDAATWGAEAHDWTPQDLKAWVDLVRAEGVLRHGAKGEIAKLGGTALLDVDRLSQWFEDEALADAWSCSLDWLEANTLLTKRTRAYVFAMRVARAAGAGVLREPPRLVVGTVHCSPPGEPVLTDQGWVPIDALNPEVHRLASYELKTNTATWGGRSGAGRTKSLRGYPFRLAKRDFDGQLVTLQTAGSRTRVTPEHRVLARFDDSFFEKWVVYLMRRGDWWRVGVCVSGHRPYVAGSIAGRLSTERADDGWLLYVGATRREALVEEARIQARYGVPGLTFEVAKDRSLSREDVQAVHESVKVEVGARAAQLLADYGLLADMPLYSRNTAKKNMRRTFTTAAANIVSEYMTIPVMPTAFDDVGVGRMKPCYLPVTARREEYHGSVYSIDVVPYHHYVSGSAIVHNSVKGGEADTVFLLPDLSGAGMEAWLTVGEGRDAAVRMLYVGMTRARNELVLCEPGGRNAVEW